MADRTSPRKVTAALLMCDIEGSTRMYSTLGDRRAKQRVDRFIEIARASLAGSGGTLIDRAGDGVFARFDDPLAAIRCAEAMHEQLDELAVRVGVHFGPVFIDDSQPDKPLEVQGLATSVTARVMALAVGGQTLLSERAAELGRDSLRGEDDEAAWAWIEHGAYALKGIDDPVCVWECGAVERTPRVQPGHADEVTAAELSNYLRRAVAMHERAPLLGFTIKARTLFDLDSLYVPLDAIIDRGRRGRDVYDSAEVAEQAATMDGRLSQEPVPLVQAFARARELERRGLVLLGDPGAGKTTHLKQVLLKIAKDGPASLGLPADTVPVLLPLQALGDPDAGLAPLIQSQLRDPMLRLPDDFGERLCKRGKLLLLLDGLDEVASAEVRGRVARFIESVLAAAPDSRVLVSCRYAGYAADAELGEEFLELHLRPLADAQMHAFVHNWYRIVMRELYRDAAQAKLAAEQKADALIAALSQSEFTAAARVYQMTRNPLLLTAICLVHHDKGELPKARARLYEESIAVLLGRWRGRDDETLLESDDALEVLKPVAAWMHQGRGRTRATAEQLREPVKHALARLRRRDLDADALLKVIRDASGLLTGWGVDSYGFMHLGFQEFLAASQLRDRAVEDPRVYDEILANFEDAWWQEVILLLLAQRNPPVFLPLMRALVQRPEFPAWAELPMVDLCVGEACMASARPFVEVLEAEAETPARQLAAARVLARTLPAELEEMTWLASHPAAEVRRWWTGRAVEVELAARGGVELVRIPAGRFVMGEGEERHEVELAAFELARTPVTNEQYGLYLAANPSASKPGYWGDRDYNQPQQPVVGVSWHDAMEYCAWAGLTLPTEAQWEYACRAGTTMAYWSGDAEEDLARVGWYARNSGGRLHTVAELPANGFGLYDMHGNVWEWCRDGWGGYATSPQPVDGLRHEPVGDGNRVIRGGSWFDGARYARSADRSWWPPGGRDAGVGFRPARVIPWSFTPSPQSG